MAIGHALPGASVGAAPGLLQVKAQGRLTGEGWGPSGAGEWACSQASA